MLIELGVVEQRHRERHRAIHEVRDDPSVIEVALRYGVARQTVHRRLRRYASGGRPSL